MTSLAEFVAEIETLSRKQLMLLAARLHVQASKPQGADPIAIIGMGGSFPGLDRSLEGFWSLQRQGLDAVREVPAARWDAQQYFAEDPDARGRSYARSASFLSDVEYFDAAFFDISPREAEKLDPQQRLLLETAWEALESAGLTPAQLSHANPTVTLGISGSEYFLRQVERSIADLDAYSGGGSSPSVAAGRLAYAFNFGGACMAVDTACSSSLVAIHQACEALRLGTTDVALAGGVSVMSSPVATISLSKARMLSPDGRCKTFDAGADGYGRGEGCGVVVLKRLGDARRDGDRVLAVIRGSASNHDGRSAGLTVPKGPAQEAVIRRALSAGGVAPEEVDYIEAHGTGTSLGDPIEVGALANVFEGRERPLLLGSVKTNIGHLEAAAGVAGLIKVVLSLQAEALPAHLHFNTPNPLIEWDRLPVEVVDKLRAWRRGERRRIAGVSSFGMGGTNAHVVVEEAPAPAPRAKDGRVQLLALSARSEAALAALRQRYLDHLTDDDAGEAADICFTAGAGRTHFAHRMVAVGRDGAELAASLRAQAEGLAVRPGASPRVAFLFTGQGSQAAEMGKVLYEQEPVFREALDRCVGLAERWLDRDLLDLMHGPASALLDETQYTQPALFSIGYALAELWESWGVKPVAMMGHSVGEYTAACRAGVFGLEDALRLVCARGRLMQALPERGAMVAVSAREEMVASVLSQVTGRIAVAGVNGPEQVVIAGEEAALAEAIGLLSREGARCERLRVSHAFHSPLMDPMLEAFGEVAREVRYAAPTLRLVTNVSGTVAGAEVATAEHWVHHAREAVRFADGLASLAAQGCDAYVEIGPRPVLLGLGRAMLGEAAAWLPSLRPGREERETLLGSLGELYRCGQAVDWRAVCGADARKVQIPTYPFQRQRFWIEPAGRTEGPRRRAPGPGAHPLLGERVDLAREPAEHVFQTALTSDLPAVIADHRVFGKPVFPAAAYLELALAAGAQMLGTDALALHDVAIEQPLMFDDDDGEVLLDLTLREEPDNGYAFEIRSLRRDDDGKRNGRHVLGVLRRYAADAGEGEPVDAASWEALPGRVGHDDLYARLAAVGLEYRGAYQGVEEVRFEGGRSLTRLRAAAADGFVVAPAALDSAFQGLAAAFADQVDADALFLPVAFERVAFHRRGVPAWSEGRARGEVGDAGLAGDIRIADAAGALLLQVDGMRVRRADAGLLEGNHVGSLLYRPIWQGCGVDGPAIRRARLILSEGTFGAALCARLRAAGERAERVAAGDVAAALAGLSGQGEAEIVDLRAVEDMALQGDARAGAPADLAARRCLALVDLVRTVADAGAGAVRLTVVTRGGNAAEAGDRIDPVAGAAWGLGRVLQLEHPQLRTRLVDLEGVSDGQDLDALLAELAIDDEENQLAWRGGSRRACRLARQAPPARALEVPGSAQYRLASQELGLIEKLVVEAGPPLVPQDDEIKIEVHAAGLNFRDVLNALGMLKEASRRLGLVSEKEMPFGGECAGTVVAAGPKATRFQVGDRVMAIMAFGSIGSFVTVREAFAAPIPQGLAMADAATIPGAFLTAWHGLCELARIGPGDRVLVHAAAGGVGQAAVQIARRAGAEIFATASPGKWPALRAMGVTNLYNSRTLDFADEIARQTQGRGVTVVLNSLNGEFVQKSMAVLAPGGRFIELGKLGVWTAGEAATRRPDVAFHAFDLGEDVALPAPATITTMMARLSTLFEAGELAPLPKRTFPIARSIEAFRHMAQARHFGKIVILLPAAGDAGGSLRPDGTYLVTGGLGALGLELARHLGERGARHLLLVGRSPASEQALMAVEALRASGVAVTLAQADVADRVALAGMLEEMRASLPPLRGIFHAAGVLDDAMLVQLDQARLERVMAPKIAGAWNLHELTRDDPLELFVCFSSVASLFGSPGQGNYAAANAWLDAFAHYRRRLGLPATSINWGAWAGAGMAAQLEQATQARQQARGLQPLLPRLALACLDAILDADTTQAAAIQVDWQALLQALPETPPFLSNFRKEFRREEGLASQFAAIGALPERERRSIIANMLRDEVARVMGMEDPTHIDLDGEFFKMGLDSLMAVEMKNRIQRQFKQSLPMDILFRFNTVRSLADYIAEKSASGPSISPSIEEPNRSAAPHPHVHLTRDPLHEEIERGVIPRLDAAAIVTIDDAVLSSTGIKWSHFLSRYLNDKPLLSSVYDTNRGRIGIYSIPRLSSQVYQDEAAITVECVEAIESAQALGARFVSLTGLIPSATSYGRTIAAALEECGQRQISVTTGHGTTSAAVVLSIIRALTVAGRAMTGEVVAFVGLGSIGQSVLRLMLARLPHPPSILVTDIYGKDSLLQQLKQELRDELGYCGTIRTALGHGGVAEEVYKCSLIICATNAPNILDIGRVAPGTIIVDDSAPHCFAVGAAIDRIKEQADIIVTEGGMIKLTEEMDHRVYLPNDDAFSGKNEIAISAIARRSSEIMGCIFSGLLCLESNEVRPTIGAVSLSDSIANFDTLREIGIVGADLHCEVYELEGDMLDGFRQAHGIAAPTG